jgi:hypothetical protein
MKKILCIFLPLFLLGCEAELSSEDKQEIAELNKELVETKALLQEVKLSNNDVTNKEFKPVLIHKPVYETESDKLFHELSREFDVIDIQVTSSDGVYKVAFINKERGLLKTKEISVPLSFFKSVYDPENRHPNHAIKQASKRGYSAKLIYLLDQGKRLDEKKAILKLFTEHFS